MPLGTQIQESGIPHFSDETALLELLTHDEQHPLIQLTQQCTTTSSKRAKKHDRRYWLPVVFKVHSVTLTNFDRRAINCVGRDSSQIALRLCTKLNYYSQAQLIFLFGDIENCLAPNSCRPYSLILLGVSATRVVLPGLRSCLGHYCTRGRLALG